MEQDVEKELMEINTIGLTAAITAFAAIWFGHVAVRRIESKSPSILLPMVLCGILGMGMELLSLQSSDQYSQIIFGILGITLLWDGFEIFRQERRVRKGHAPANPKNPRHAGFLAEENSRATIEDLLDREPADQRNETN